MAQDSIDKVLAARKPAQEISSEGEVDKFYSVLGGEGLQEHYLELRLRDGLRICLSYTDLMWFSFDPEGPKLDLEFGGIFATIKGRGLGEASFSGIQQKRAPWTTEADTEMQAHNGTKVFIEEITFLTKQDEATPPE